MMANLYKAVDKLSLNFRLFRPEALIVQITHKPGADVRPVDARENTPLLGKIKARIATFDACL